MTTQPQPTGSHTDATTLVSDTADSSQGPEPAAAAIAGRSPAQMAWARLRRDRASLAALIVTVIFLLAAAFSPLLSSLEGWGPVSADLKAIDPNTGNFPIGSLGGISGHHWLGVEPGTGYDVFSRLIYGLRTSLLVSLSAAIISTVLGVVVGLAAGYFGGKIDSFLNWVMNIMLAFPQLLFIIALTPVITNAVSTNSHGGTSETLQLGTIVVIISAFAWAYTARLVRGQVLSLREREFVDAARIMGAGWGHILFKQLLPNLWAPILISFALAIPTNIATEAALSYLGVGVVTPNPDLGAMLNAATQYYLYDPTYMLVPGIALLLVVLALNLLGDGVRDALDPRANRA
ncbi:ABC transporter permease [Streptacidiphilus sp. P02-A3a]|uniref:ABC transporter permease n=1 Tax=Streptacidiphilus sp. P02-A3a TaxID=2704468 RepID=UPI0015F7DA73|nr:ABC transporter permease [Streptacidiphilus sp. P02-A3a]QMU72418.1 ABC transporter permease [Streptacidiphilus sp. P02-A3a]